MFKIDHGIFATFWLTLIIMTGFNCLHFGFLKMVIFFWIRIVERDHCGMGGKKSITHFRQFSATFGPQEVEPSHDIYICRIVTHILSIGQLISKAIYGLLTSPEKWTDEFVFFAFLLFRANKKNSSIFFWENLSLDNLLFGFISPLI